MLLQKQFFTQPKSPLSFTVGSPSSSGLKRVLPSEGRPREGASLVPFPGPWGARTPRSRPIRGALLSGHRVTAVPRGGDPSPALPAGTLIRALRAAAWRPVVGPSVRRLSNVGDKHVK